MKLDALKQFSRLRNVLVTERTALEKRLGQISDLLGPTSTPNHGTIQAPHRRNSLSLKQAIIKATTARPLTKEEILAAVKQLGFKFTTARPMASLNAYLYQKGQFKRRNGRFTPGKAAR